MTHDQKIAKAAKIYQAAIRRGDPAPIKAIMVRFGCSRATAHRWIAAARLSGIVLAMRHRPRRARFGSGQSWLACRICLQPWPCEVGIKRPA